MDQWKYILFRIPLNFISAMDKQVKNRPGFTRTAWVLEAISEKLQKAKEENKK